MSFGLHFKDFFEIQIKKDNLYYPKSIKNFVYKWNSLLHYFTQLNIHCDLHYLYNNFLLLTSIVYKEIFNVIFFNSRFDIELLNKSFNIFTRIITLFGNSFIE